MTRTYLLASLAVIVVGCGPTVDQNAPATNKMDSVTMVRPTEEKIGVATMTDFATESGMKAYPGSENSAGEKFNHGDGVEKSVIEFTTSDSVEKIAEFYKAEGLDVSVKTKPIGMTKGGAQVMIAITSGPSGKNVVRVTGLVSKKKAP